MTPSDGHAAFHDQHGSGCFGIPNLWDGGSARMMAALGTVPWSDTGGANDGINLGSGSDAG